MAQSKYAIETIGLTKAFTDWWGRTRVLAVDDLNLRIENNEVYGLLGPNGSGKSTTLKMLLGLLKPTKGVGFILGGKSDEHKIASRVGFLPEESYLYKYLSARETLEFYGKLFGLNSKVIKMRADSLLDMVGLSSMSNRAIGTFSKGMQRRIGLAQALINDPDVLILDEPTSGLDPIGTRQIKELIRALAARGKTVLMCSHLLADVEDVCDRICVLYGGKVQCEGRVSELLQKSDERQIITKSLNDEAMEKIKQVLKEQQAEFEVSSPSFRLEDFFINIVTEAQKRNQSNSGAMSSEKIGDFLSGKQAEPEKDKSTEMLEKLVKADVKSKPAEHKEQTQKVEKEKAPEPVADKGLLKELTKKEKSPEQVKVEKPAPEQIQEKKIEQVNKDLLKDLTEKKLGDKPDA